LFGDYSVFGGVQGSLVTWSVFFWGGVGLSGSLVLGWFGGPRRRGVPRKVFSSPCLGENPRRKGRDLENSTNIKFPRGSLRGAASTVRLRQSPMGRGGKKKPLKAKSPEMPGKEVVDEFPRNLCAPDGAHSKRGKGHPRHRGNELTGQGGGRGGCSGRKSFVPKETVVGGDSPKRRRCFQSA